MLSVALRSARDVWTIKTYSFYSLDDAAVRICFKGRGAENDEVPLHDTKDIHIHIPHDPIGEIYYTQRTGGDVMAATGSTDPSDIHESIEKAVDDVISRAHDKQRSMEQLTIDRQTLIAVAGNITSSQFYNVSGWRYLSIEYESVKYHNRKGKITVDKDRWIEERPEHHADLICDVDDCSHVKQYRDGRDVCATHAEDEELDADDEQVDEDG